MQQVDIRTGAFVVSCKFFGPNNTIIVSAQEQSDREIVTFQYTRNISLVPMLTVCACNPAVFRQALLTANQPLFVQSMFATEPILLRKVLEVGTVQVAVRAAHLELEIVFDIFGERSPPFFLSLC